MASGGGDGEIREGLLCPICMQDWGSVDRLLQHFDEDHNTEDKDVIQSFKDFLGKAKKILKADSQEKVPSNQQWVDWEPQEQGALRSRWTEFKKVRCNRTDYAAAETNKLIIRLDKIISDLPGEAGRRRRHEQNVVPWISDEDVKLCPHCARSFNLLRRKHHCRLCGAIQCDPCSQFILLSFARKLTDPGYAASPAASDRSGPRHRTATQPESYGPMQVLRRSGSSSSLTSLTSLVDPATGEGRIRVCFYCKELLERRDRQMEVGGTKPLLVQLYDELRGHMDKAANLIPTFLNMSDSLSEGKSTYQLSDAQQCRVKLLKMAEYIGGYSKKIETLGLDDAMQPTYGSALTVQQKIRLSAVHFLKDHLMGLPNLPTEQQVAQLQLQRKKALENQIAQEKAAALQARQTQLRRAKPASDGEAVSLDRGWGVETSKIRNVNEADDPMLQQIQIIRNYIQQARLDHRYDEVAMLEKNLRELELEHERNQQRQQS